MTSSKERVADSCILPLRNLRLQGTVVPSRSACLPRQVLPAAQVAQAAAPQLYVVVQPLAAYVATLQQEAATLQSWLQK